MRFPVIPVACAALLLATRAPASAQIAVLGNTLQERVVQPGESYTGTIMVMNPTREVQTAKLYQTDYSFHSDGTSHFDAPGTLGRSNATWVSLGISQVTVPPGETVPVQFTVKVPQTDTLTGTYWSVVMVEGVPKSMASPRAGQPGVGLISVIRYGVQVVSQFPRSTKRQAEFEKVEVVADKSGARALEFDIRNPGERAYRLDVRVQIFDEAGAQVASFQQQHNLLYPGSSLREHFKLPKLPSQTYQVLVVADTREDEVFGGQFTLRL